MCFGKLTKPKNTAASTANAADLQEKQRLAQIQAAIKGVNDTFNSPDREAQRQGFVDSTRELFQSQLGKQRESVDRNSRFALARSGLSLGSADADTQSAIERRFQDAVLQNERRAQGAGAQLQGEDEQARLNLIALAQAGLDSTTASDQALSSLRANIGSAKNAINQETLGNVFNDFAEIFKSSLERDQAGKDQKFGSLNLFGPSASGSGDQFRGFG